MILENVGYLDLTQNISLNESFKDIYTPVYILLTNTGSMMSKTIKNVTGDAFTHASLSFDIKLKEVYSFNINGFVKESLNMFKEKFGNIDIGVFCVLVPKDGINIIKQKIQEFTNNMKQYSYNILGLFGVLFDKPINRDNKMFCSQFVDSMLKLGGSDVTNKNSGLVRPQEFATSNVIFKLFDGKLNDYTDSKAKRNLNKIKISIKEEVELMNNILNEGFREDHNIPKSYIKKCDYKTLFFISDTNMDNHTLNPRIPNNYLTKNGYEDNTICRVCVAPSIKSSLIALSKNLKDVELYVHIVDNISQAKQCKPSVNLVPDSIITNEVWITNSVKLKCVGKIKVLDAYGDGLKYKYGEKNQYEAELYSWKYKWIEKFDKNILNEEMCMGRPKFICKCGTKIHLEDDWNYTGICYKCGKYHDHRTPDGCIYGLPQQQSFPINTPTEINQILAQCFVNCPNEHKQELADNIKKRISELGLNNVATYTSGIEKYVSLNETTNTKSSTPQDGFYTPKEIEPLVDKNGEEILHGDTKIKDWFEYYRKRCTNECEYDMELESAWFNRLKKETNKEIIKTLGWNPVLEFTSYNRYIASQRLIETLNEENKQLLLTEEVTKISVDDKGNLIYNKNIDFQLEFNKAHKLLLSYEKTNNIESMKYELCKLWYINTKIEQKIDSMNKEERKPLVDIRARVLNDFNKYMKFILKYDKSFNFSEYIKTTEYDPDKIVITRHTINTTIDLAKRLLHRH